MLNYRLSPYTALLFYEPDILPITYDGLILTDSNSPELMLLLSRKPHKNPMAICGKSVVELGCAESYFGSQNLIILINVTPTY
jgi:hypothetical protein